MRPRSVKVIGVFLFVSGTSVCALMIVGLLFGILEKFNLMGFLMGLIFLMLGLMFLVDGRYTGK